MKRILQATIAAITVAMTSITTTPSKADSHFSYRTLITDAGRSLSTNGKLIVTCGLPTRENPLIDILASQHELGATVRAATGHMLAKRLHQPHPKGGVSTEMWIFTPALGDWWRLKAIRVHPDDMEKLTGNVEEVTQTAMRGEFRQIVDSPFLPEPLIVRGPDAEEEVDAHITGMLPNASGSRSAAPSLRSGPAGAMRNWLSWPEAGFRPSTTRFARTRRSRKSTPISCVRHFSALLGRHQQHITGMLPNASGMRCAPGRPGVAGASDIERAQRALARHGHDPGPIDGQMGPRTEAALRAFQTEQGQAPNGQLDEGTLERLGAP